MYKFYTHKIGVLFWRALAYFSNLNIKLFSIAALFLISAAAKGQQITLKVNSASLESVFKEIRNQSGYDIFFDRNLIQNMKAGDLNLNKVSLEQAVIVVLKNLPLDYTIASKTIIIKAKTSLPVKTGPEPIIPVKVNGKVTDTTGRPLHGATIKVVDNDNYTVTDKDGKFSIDAIQGTQVIVSYIGYESTSFTVAERSVFQNIMLHLAPPRLSEINVVSTGYQSIPRERATGSFAQPVKKEFDIRVAPDVLSKLSGITPGLVFNANTATARSGQVDMNIRGRSTIFANDQPLIIVDNFPFSGNINNINPNDVENITILKDAASASIWGVRAGNGVIVITTKKGKFNQPLRINFNANLTIAGKPDLNYNPNQLDVPSYIGLEQFLFSKGYYDGNLANTTTYPVISPVVELLALQRSGSLSSSDLNSQLDALKGLSINEQLTRYIYQPAKNQQYALNFSGGNTKMLYYLSAGYDKGVANLKENSNQRITINSQNTFYLSKKVEVNAGVNIIQSTNEIDNTLSQFNTRLFPYSQLATQNGDPLSIVYNLRQNYVQSATTRGFLNWAYTPLNELGNTDNTLKTLDARLTGSLRYNILNGLSAEVKYQYQRVINQNRNYQSQQSFYARNLINTFSILTAGRVSGYNLPLGGILNLASANISSNNLRGQVNYHLDRKKHSLTAIAGYELAEVKAENNSSILYGYNDDLATFTNINPLVSYPTNPSGSSTINGGLGIGGTLSRIRSTFANAAYTYDGLYTISGSARIDGTNYFGVATNQKNVPLWSAGVKWNIGQENFYRSNWLPNLSLRGSYGFNGNVDQSVTGVTTFLYRSNAAYTNLNYAQISNTGNPDLRWEKTGIFNIGLDFSFKNNRVSGSLEYFIKKETDLLGFKAFPANAGISSLKGNYADMKGEGFDVIITANNLKGKFNWTSTVIISKATDKVTRYDVIPTTASIVGASPTAIPNIGKPVFGVYGYRWGGLDPITGNPKGYINGVLSEDYATINIRTPLSELVYAGPARPVYFGGFNNFWSFKGFTLGVQVNYKFGYYFMAPSLSYSAIGSNGSAFLNVSRDFNRRWQSAGDEQFTNVPSLVYPFVPARDQFYQNADINIQKADHIRLQDVSLSYEFTKLHKPKLPFNTLQVFVFANNLGVLWRANKQGLDPDAVPGNADITTIPTSRAISFGIKGSL
ncbi:SusC/RagA family TonB-linked outer membrane protein [uncultured Mucilaginibacter sp.]|uniref:SusC/RagA family TonB-linked outer membrane protein n=1 Tax=uncultured Mucilaginibacter sp. TaxID=797541 RepID=UPI0025F4A646|nr:SusC/RagA family TonB-linked outer membrane protein [uncultured Mucilaginibacter sp.]